MTIFFIILLSIASSICYRAGGWGNEGRIKFPRLPGWLFNTKARDVGCGLCTIWAFFLLKPTFLPWVSTWMVWVVSILTVPIMLGTLSTYWDELFEYDNFWFHGFMCGVAFFLFAIITGHWIGFTIRCFTLSILMGWWSAIIGLDWLEEGFRGASLVFTIPLLLI